MYRILHLLRGKRVEVSERLLRDRPKGGAL